ncbi:hypothetical protein GMD37_12275 [Parasutterella excrementihominis]|nr:hypothetical protein [Parasutterella excrementihominis]
MCACLNSLTKSPRKLIVGKPFISAPVTVQSHKTAAANKDKRNANEH